MTFDATKMALLADGANKKVYFYSSTADALATIVAADYFLAFTDQLDVGDMVIIEDSSGAVTTRRVSATSASTVTVAAMDDQKIHLTGRIADISSAGQVYLVSPVAGKVTGIRSVIAAAITVADATLTGKINGSAITGGAITVVNAGSAPGDTDVATPTAANSVAAGDNIEIETDGGSTTASECTVVVEITPN